MVSSARHPGAIPLALVLAKIELANVTSLEQTTADIHATHDAIADAVDPVLDSNLVDSLRTQASVWRESSMRQLSNWHRAAQDVLDSIKTRTEDPSVEQYYAGAEQEAARTSALEGKIKYDGGEGRRGVLKAAELYGRKDAAPMTCPRCSSAALDSVLDIARSQILTEIRRDQLNSQANFGWYACLSVLLLGIPLIVYGFWRLITLPQRQALENQRVAEIVRCTRYTCRECGLSWYADEWDTLHARAGPSEQRSV